MRWAGFVACIEANSNAYRSLAAKAEGK